MSLSDKEIEEFFQKLDEGANENVPEEILKDHQLIKKGLEYIEEGAFREKLNEAHVASNKQNPKRNSFYFSMGIAASVALVLFWYTSYNGGSEPTELQIDEAPAYADSASYDSLKNVKVEVDKSSQ